MIGRLSGLLAAKQPPQIVIDVGGALHQADFRSDDKALHAHNVVLWYITR